MTMQRQRLNLVLGQGLSSSDSSDSASPPVSGAGRQTTPARNVQETGFYLDLNLMRRLREENPFLLCFQSFLRSSGPYSEAHVDSLCNALARVMKVCSGDRDPSSPELSDLVDIGLMHRLAQVMQGMHFSSRTKDRYF